MTPNEQNLCCLRCEVEMEYSGRVHACQGCGVSRAWLEEQRKKE